MLHKSELLEAKAVLATAAKICAAARTAPKAHGKDTLHSLVLTGEEKELLAKKIEEIGIREMRIECIPGTAVMLRTFVWHKP